MRNRKFWVFIIAIIAIVFLNFFNKDGSSAITTLAGLYFGANIYNHKIYEENKDAV